MRILLVGTPAERLQLRQALEDAGLEIIDEFPSLERARRSRSVADAIVIPSLTDRRNDGGDPQPLVVEPLTPREREVLEALAEGLPNKAIAARLGISDQTVKFHVASICGKLGAANRTEAVGRGVRLGLITL
jgi:DNA-binding NarL/FixJ family response regulator